MATDRDRFARVLDKRFDSVGYALQAKTPDAIARLCAYIEKRESEADPNLRAMFLQADRILKRASPLLFPDHDPEADRIWKRSLDSNSAMRVAHAFEDVRQNGGDLALALATRQVRWINGCLQTQERWPEARAPFANLQKEVIDELASRHRKRYLGIGAPIESVRSSAKGLVDIMAIGVPAKLP